MSATAAHKPYKPELRKLDPSSLRPGMTLPGTVRTSTGRVLIRAGRILQAGDLGLLGDYIQKGVFGGAEWPENHFLREIPPLTDSPGSSPTAGPSGSAPFSTPGGLALEGPPGGKAFVAIALRNLEVGQRLSHPLYNHSGVLLVPAETILDESLIAKLRRQGVSEVHVEASALWEPKPEVAPWEPVDVAARLDTLAAHIGPRSFRLPVPTRPRPRLEIEQLRDESDRAQDLYGRAADRVQEISLDLYAGKPASASAAAEVIAEFLDMVQLDASLLPALVKLRATPGEYLFHHGMNVALLSIAVAAEFAVPREGCQEIGLGALLQDLGMLQFPEALRLAPRSLRPTERAEIASHPLYTLSFLERLEGLSDTSRLVAYQAHERSDGSGYPRRRHHDHIHPYARVVAAADVYAAIISHRPHRNARRPYEAMELLLHETRRGRFDSDVVRALIDCLSLFPIGSYVRLSDGQVAKVLRSNPGLHTQPVVLPLNPDGSESDHEVDLSRTSDVCVIQALGGKGDLELMFFKAPGALS